MASFIDLHIHTDMSDGADTPAEVLEKVVRQGIRTFAVTDHDNIAGSQAIEDRVPEGYRLIRGIEFSCRENNWKCHILGYGFDPADSRFRKALETARQLRLENLEKRLVYLEEHKIRLSEEEKAWLRSQPSPAKPHLGNVLVARGLADDLDTAIARYINPCKTGDSRIEAELAVKGIRGAGGIPVWAHPLGGEGEKRIDTNEFKKRLAVLMDYGIRGLECFYSRYSEKEITFLLEQAAAHGLLVSGGSDYHGGNKKGISLGMLNTADAPVDPARLTVLKALGMG